ncbi:MAG: bifunctional phosphoribosylaminoimidazolecarboxamide formyltransferase/IMP cyclohydrolase [Bacteroidota bacterium]|jgi:phosphoribosylaminoimidazolecarboxamide formyltransferase/IMP cyclohydrolase
MRLYPRASNALWKIAAIFQPCCNYLCASILRPLIGFFDAIFKHMNKTIQKALVSVFYKDGLEDIVRTLVQQGVQLYSTGGTQSFIEQLGLPCTPVEELTSYPSILGGRVKTLHPKVFGAILAKRADEQHVADMQQYEIPAFDLVIVDLYPFEETVATTNEHAAIIEKIDIGGPSMIRAAAKNHADVAVLASKADYAYFYELLQKQGATTSLDDRKYLATRAFQVVAQYDMAIANWFLETPQHNITIPLYNGAKQSLRYGENPHQSAAFYGNLNEVFTQLHGKELSYNNLVDVDAAVQLVAEFSEPTFAVIKHTNACGVASAATILEAWTAALAGDPESAFGGVLCCNGEIDKATAEAISEIFCEVLIAKSFSDDALAILQQKKNRILLVQKQAVKPEAIIKNVINGILVQEADNSVHADWQEAGARECTAQEKADLDFANRVCKHLKSNAIAIVKNRQLIGKGCGQTSRVDALKYSLEKAQQFGFDTKGAVLASDAFFPFDDCVRLAHAAGISAVIQPGGSIRDADSINYAKDNGIAMVITGTRHFKH